MPPVKKTAPARKAAKKVVTKTAKKTVKKAAAAETASESEAECVLSLQWGLGGQDSAAIVDDSLPREAMRWSYLAQSRQQSTGSDSGGSEASKDSAVTTLENLGITRAILSRLVSAPLVQVNIPWAGGEQSGWAARIMPWEFVIIRAVKELDATARFKPVIVRFLSRRQDGFSRTPRKPQPANAVAVLNLPMTPLAEAMRPSCLRERQMVSELLKPPVLQPNVSCRKEFKDVLKDSAGMVLHLLGYEETHAHSTSVKHLRQQLWLGRNEANDDDWCDFEEAAGMLTENGDPELVSFSFCRTAPRLAALTVAHGAHAAIGFQDIVTDEICESFFSLFYRHWQPEEWDLVKAFTAALKGLHGKLKGTGIVLWSRHSLLVSPPEAARVLSTAAAAFSAPPQECTTAVPPRTVQTISIDARPNESLNYSLLHNQHLLKSLRKLGQAKAPIGLLKAFTITSSATSQDPLYVEAEVVLYVGDQECVWRSLVTLELRSTELHYEVCLPLTSSLTRSLRECLRTTMSVSVSHEARLIYRQSYVVTLLAIDEWRDDGVCHRMLPSFVLPRDPAILELTRIARRCLCSMSDDFSAGFDGYQSGDPLEVDLQVKAIWAVIIQDWQLGYINPPPSFANQSQRLRSPSSILSERAGTCVDLALLLAASLEYVGIYSFIVLCPGHAFVGYCRYGRYVDGAGDCAPLFLPAHSSQYKETKPAASLSINNAETTACSADREVYTDWVFGKDFHKAIREKLKSGEIAALEATGLTREMPFATALRYGDANLRNPLQFDYLIDIPRARVPANSVTPLPLLLKQEER